MFTLVGVLVGLLGVVMLGLIAALIIVIRKRCTEKNTATLLVYVGSITSRCSGK